MRAMIGAIAYLAAAFVTDAQAAGIEGQWARGDGNAKVRIAPCGSAICATNTWIKPGTPSEKAGDKLVMTIKPSEEGVYSGEAFDPQRDLNYRITVKVDGDRMSTRGCVIAGLICRDVDWTRIR
ncbi:DUF2147 domain-containing protein [Rhizobium tropici]|uniref:DUF2147 domain-containing protein n=2 Tax=Rhizobium TaxID=379 RepID=A0A6P1C4C6_RHITR|nr:hypothetical protein RTCIAT899_PA00405 [Rhizobium tropici CIAT 899]MBB4243686.1 uncharacterized protein (DUF2147 family) [Rhizobium tropici]TGE93086.1 DUF2147 domain-containing protein [Rhizobium sp. SEMIA 4088]MBB5595865.1 uncharacterized protein (DUF2147 family) [Rhizobium tropici]MBB6493857.1 uncharacterized protein (DUF2147 family) [Rhizobium tropici]